jgi:adenylylsulfate kinase
LTSSSNGSHAPRGITIWLTGLSGAGKTTIANLLSTELGSRGRHVETLDGDIVRQHLSKGLGFSKEDRDENVRRIGWVAGRLTAHGATVVAAVISPYRDLRAELRHHIDPFFEIYVKCPLEVLIQRDPKGLYKKALAGDIPNFTGISDPYEEPLSPELTIDTHSETVEQSVTRVIEALEAAGHLRRPVAATA